MKKHAEYLFEALDESALEEDISIEVMDISDSLGLPDMAASSGTAACCSCCIVCCCCGTE